MLARAYVGRCPGGRFVADSSFDLFMLFVLQAEGFPGNRLRQEVAGQILRANEFWAIAQLEGADPENWLRSKALWIQEIHFLRGLFHKCSANSFGNLIVYRTSWCVQVSRQTSRRMERASQCAPDVLLHRARPRVARRLYPWRV